MFGSLGREVAAARGVFEQICVLQEALARRVKNDGKDEMNLASLDIQPLRPSMFYSHGQKANEWTEQVFDAAALLHSGGFVPCTQTLGCLFMLIHP